MPPLVTIRDLTIGFRGPSLLDNVSCQIQPGQRIGLLGRNGAGKTTLMRLISGQVEPDAGEIQIAAGVKVAFLQQDVPQNLKGPISDIVATGLEHADEEEWKTQNRVETIFSRMNLDDTLAIETLSSGMKRRVLLARALVCEPDLLLLDEPTNHLDIEAIDWLETFLLKMPTALMFVTHDRVFLRKVSTRILEIDRGRIFDWSCDYPTFLKRKAQALETEEKENALFDKRLAEEEVWIRKGIKARRTRNEGRVRALKVMREERSGRRDKTGVANLQIQDAQKSGRLVVEAKGISFSYEELSIVKDFSTLIMRGDKVGFIGPNGAGKTTLLRILLGKLQVDEGTVRIGTNIEIAYFDQLREQLDENETVMHNVGDGYDTIQIGDTKKHVLGYLQDFLFTPERARTQVRFLSGGERNRILLARLFAKPANLLVMDEPTNDLDSETLELLEDRLAAFPGTLLLVSHDRAFLNNVVTSSIVFEETSEAGLINVKEYVGGYDDWQRQRPAKPGMTHADKRPVESNTRLEAPKPANVVPVTNVPAARKLKYKEQRELESLPGRIEELESKVAAITAQMSEPDFYKKHGGKIAATQSELQSAQSELNEAFTRWDELEQFAG